MWTYLQIWGCDVLARFGHKGQGTVIVDERVAEEDFGTGAEVLEKAPETSSTHLNIGNGGGGGRKGKWGRGYGREGRRVDPRGKQGERERKVRVTWMEQ